MEEQRLISYGDTVKFEITKEEISGGTVEFEINTEELFVINDPRKSLPLCCFPDIPIIMLYVYL